MNKNNIFSLILLILTFTSISMGIESQLFANEKESSKIRLRSFSIFPVMFLTELKKSYELHNKLKEEAEKLKARFEEEQMAKKELQSRKIQQYLITLQSSKTFLNDFHSNRYL